MKTNILKVKIKDEYLTYNDALMHMNNQNVKHLGWLNAGIKLPKQCTFTQVYQNWSGSSTLFCDIDRRISYSVDMGD